MVKSKSKMSSLVNSTQSCELGFILTCWTWGSMNHDVTMDFRFFYRV